eukprot:1158772-Pelagomonas_calceolata.AAC.6
MHKGADQADAASDVSVAAERMEVEHMQGGKRQDSEKKHGGHIQGQDETSWTRPQSAHIGTTVHEWLLARPTCFQTCSQCKEIAKFFMVIATAQPTWASSACS